MKTDIKVPYPTTLERGRMCNSDWLDVFRDRQV